MKVLAPVVLVGVDVFLQPNQLLLNELEGITRLDLIGLWLVRFRVARSKLLSTGVDLDFLFFLNALLRKFSTSAGVSVAFTGSGWLSRMYKVKRTYVSVFVHIRNRKVLSPNCVNTSFLFFCFRIRLFHLPFVHIGFCKKIHPTVGKGFRISIIRFADAIYAVISRPTSNFFLHQISRCLARTTWHRDNRRWRGDQCRSL